MTEQSIDGRSEGTGKEGGLRQLFLHDKFMQSGVRQIRAPCAEHDVVGAMSHSTASIILPCPTSINTQV